MNADHESKDDVHDSSFIAIKEIDNGKGKKQCYDVLEEVAQSSRGAMIIDNFYCTICMEALPIIECFPIGGCTHAFCMSCVRQYITAKVEENVLSIGCPDPGCKDGALHPEACRNFIAPQLFQRWGAALCDMAIGALKFYCPFKDCSVMLVDDHVDGDEAITTWSALTAVGCSARSARCRAMTASTAPSSSGLARTSAGGRICS